MRVHKGKACHVRRHNTLAAPHACGNGVALRGRNISASFPASSWYSVAITDLRQGTATEMGSGGPRRGGSPHEGRTDTDLRRRYRPGRRVVKPDFLAALYGRETHPGRGWRTTGGHQAVMWQRVVPFMRRRLGRLRRRSCSSAFAQRPSRCVAKRSRSAEEHRPQRSLRDHRLVDRDLCAHRCLHKTLGAHP